MLIKNSFNTRSEFPQAYTLVSNIPAARITEESRQPELLCPMRLHLSSVQRLMIFLSYT